MTSPLRSVVVAGDARPEWTLVPDAAGGTRPERVPTGADLVRSLVQAQIGDAVLQHDDRDASLVVLIDEAGAFRATDTAWPAALTAPGREPVVVWSTSDPLGDSKLRAALLGACADRLIAIVAADDLRTHANISAGLSWERTAREFAWQARWNPELLPLGACAHVIVCFGTAGAIHLSRATPGSPRLYYDPAATEDESAGDAATFVAAFAARLAVDGPNALAEAIRSGLRALRGDARVSEIDVPAAGDASSPDPEFWRILATLSDRRLEQTAFQIVTGGDAAALDHVPVARFGALKTIDRAEIESFRSIRRLIQSYCATESPGRPLSIAVFGPPGSGKSFGVTQVAQGIVPGRIEKREFNLSQSTSIADLTAAFHWVRDVALAGRIALAVFDEFDTVFQGHPLGWLKYFLAPMQDGAFKEGEAMRPIGRAIFVFAGGTSSTYAAFARKADAHVDAKLPDFASRLRGYVDVLGPNASDEHDRFFMVRRAMLLRSLIERKAPQLVARGTVNIDRGVLRGFIKTPRFLHGARSMEAILDMSMLVGRRRFDQAALPPPAQLALHTDAEMFMKLVAREVLFGAARERIARAIHEHYRQQQREIKSGNDPAMQPWDQLTESLRESNRRQADDIPEKLAYVGYGFAASNGQSATVAFTVDEIERLAEIEHERFVAERRAAGWTQGPRDVAAKQTPHLVSWSALSDDVREYDRTAVRAIPEVMARAGFEIYRLE